MSKANPRFEEKQCLFFYTNKPILINSFSNAKITFNDMNIA